MMLRAGGGVALILLATSAKLWAEPPGHDAAPPPRPETTAPTPTPPKPRPVKADDAATDNQRPGTQGRLIPPEEVPPQTPTTQQTDASADDARTGARAPEALRESDFDFAACRLALTIMGARYEQLPPVTESDSADCGIARPIRVTSILPGITLDGGAVMRCDTARSLAFWMRDFVGPAARRLPGAPSITGVALGTTYQCRAVVGGPSTAKVSEHALGNAIDIASFHLSDGSDLAVTPRADAGDIAMAFQAAVQAAACVDFTTVLGPGSNAAHDDHLHLDIKDRRNGYRLCQ